MFQSYTCNNTFIRLLKSTCYCTNQTTMTSNPTWLVQPVMVRSLVISGKQPSSGLLQLCGLYLCVLAKLSATVVLFNIFYTSRKHFVFQVILSHRAITSTNVDGTASQTAVPGYHTLSITGYEASCV